MTITARTDLVAVNGEDECGLIDAYAVLIEAEVDIEAEANKRIAMQRFVSTMLRRFVDQRMVSPPDICILVVRIDGNFDLAEFVIEWNRQIWKKKQAVAKFFLDRMVVVDAIYYPDDGTRPYRFDLNLAN
jgi:hypothetical protein